MFTLPKYAPTFYQNVFKSVKDELKNLVGKYIDAKTVHLVVSTMLSKSNPKLESLY